MTAVLLPTNALTFPQEPKTPPGPPLDRTDVPGPTGAGTAQPPAGSAGPAGSPCGGVETFAMFGLFLVLLYFMILRPEQRRKREAQAMMSALKQGDHVVTIGGMHGTVASLQDKTVTVRVDNLKMTFDRSAIARVERDEPPKTAT